MKRIFEYEIHLIDGEVVHLDGDNPKLGEYLGQSKMTWVRQIEVLSEWVRDDTGDAWKGNRQ